MTFLVFFSWKFLRVQYSEQQLKCERPFQFCHGFLETTLTAPEFVLDVIRRGFKLLFAEYPPPCLLPNYKSAVAHGCIVELSVPIFCVNPLTIAEGKKAALSN